MVIQASKEELGIANLGDTVTVDLASKAGAPSTDVSADLWDGIPASTPYCTDVAANNKVMQHAVATSGTATFTIAPSRGTGNGETYAVTVSLKGVIVRGADGFLERIDDVTYDTVTVGWFPG